MRRRTKRVRLRARPFVILALLVNVAAGVALSPVSAVRRVRVEGAPPADARRLAGLIQGLRGMPCARVNARELESAALQNSELRLASLARNPFGSAVLRVVRRTPVARMYAFPDAALSDEGVVYRATDLPKDLPTVNPLAESPDVGLALGNGWRSADVAHLAALMRGLGRGEPPRIDLVGGGRVCLNIESGTVDLGRCDELDAKVARLREYLLKRPDLFASFRKLSLVRLDDPAFEPRTPVLPQGSPKP